MPQRANFSKILNHDGLLMLWECGKYPGRPNFVTYNPVGGNSDEFVAPS